jgi:hypothetical protein
MKVQKHACDYCGYAEGPRRGHLQTHNILRNGRTVSVLTHPKCLAKLRRQQEQTVTLRSASHT